MIFQIKMYLFMIFQSSYFLLKGQYHEKVCEIMTENGGISSPTAFKILK
jgi:hypothetical protein